MGVVIRHGDLVSSMKKFPGVQESTKELNWRPNDGIPRVSLVTIPKIKGGKPDLKHGTAKGIARQLDLSMTELKEFAACTLTAEAYLEHLKR